MINDVINTVIIHTHHVRVFCSYSPATYINAHTHVVVYIKQHNNNV